MSPFILQASIQEKSSCLLHYANYSKLSYIIWLVIGSVWTPKNLAGIGEIFYIVVHHVQFQDMYIGFNKIKMHSQPRK